MRWVLNLAAVAAVVALALAVPVEAKRVSDIKNTKHNLSATAPQSTIKATGAIGPSGTDQVCVFCHTPHAATQGAQPIWNRQLSTATYTPYTSKSLDATGLDQPGGSSKLCLSCHDGTVALGQVNVLNGAASTITLQNTDGGRMPGGSGDQTGFTRKLGTDLGNDHPISFTYDAALADRDGDLQNPLTSRTDSNGVRHIDSRAPGYRPKLPLENGELQCTTCHDPHIRDDSPSEGNIKFLRQNRFQKAAPTGTYDPDTDQICLACHTKAGWAGSAHANPAVATPTYTANASNIREFPAGKQVWEAGCLNCHDTHTVQGSRRLLREGTTGSAVGGFKSGGSSAIEEACYQCHSLEGTTTTGGVSGRVLTGQGVNTFQVPDIKSDFQKPRRMPIDKFPEKHDIGDSPATRAGKDFLESDTLLADRHVECSDCHNPHRVIRNKLFTGAGLTTAGTHDHDPAAGTHTNIASGVLRGTWGVEPVWTSINTISWGEKPLRYDVKRGDPGASASTAVTEGYVTREYQVCLKCHSDYAYGDLPPSVGLETGSTPLGTNGLETFTNQAMEFAAPNDDVGKPSGRNNHRSWHPVMAPTGRTTTLRSAGATNWLAPWSGDSKIGYQTMYCSDCHGRETAAGTVDPSPGSESGPAWGPHGSNNDFILKGPWSSATGGSGTEGDLCFKCHSRSRYAGTGGGSSGFGGSKDNNLHSYHADKVGKMRCSWCHVAVPHGWKNKALLVDLNNVGAEAGLPEGTEVRAKTRTAYTQGPYYMNALNKIRSFPASGSWSEGNCGSAGKTGNGQSGRDWMRDSSENCANPP